MATPEFKYDCTVIKHGLVFLLLLICFSSNSQLSIKGKELNRRIGAACFSYRIDESGLGVLCSFKWNDSLIGLAHLQRSLPASSFVFSDRMDSGICRLSIQQGDATTRITTLSVNIQPKAPFSARSIKNYQGLVAAWLAEETASLAIDSFVYQLTPTAVVVTKPIGAAKNDASISIYNGVVLVYTTTITQTAPFFTLGTDIILGDFKIEKGMQLTLQIPSKIQPGSILMQARFSSFNIPPTSINALVATWVL